MTVASFHGTGKKPGLLSGQGRFLSAFVERQHGTQPAELGLVLGPVLGITGVLSGFAAGHLIDYCYRTCGTLHVNLPLGRYETRFGAEVPHILVDPHLYALPPFIFIIPHLNVIFAKPTSKPLRRFAALGDFLCLMLGVAAIKAPNFDLLVVFSALGAVGASLRQGLQAVVQAESDGVRGTVQGMLESWLLTVWNGEVGLDFGT